MRIRDLLALCAADSHRISKGESRLWLFGPGDTPGVATALPGPTGLEAEALRSWGRDLSQAAGALAGVVHSSPVVALPDPACPMLDGAIDGAQPARLLLTTAPANPIGVAIAADESIAVPLLRHAQHVACARFN